MKRTLILGYGALSYAFFFVTFLYSIGFIGNIWVPKSIDSAPTMSLVSALATNIGLLAVFAIQHSGMARPAFKRWLTKYMPKELERSTYVLMSTICLALLMAFWAPIGGVIWNVHVGILQWTMYALYLLSWLLLLYATFLINHFDLFGLRQVWAAFCQKELKELAFVTPALYKIVRHPIYLGWLGIAWFTPTMTVTHAVFAIGATLYILIGIKLEENDLQNMHPEYIKYKEQVPALIPSIKASKLSFETINSSKKAAEVK